MTDARRVLAKWALVVLMGLEGLSLMPYRDVAGIWTDGYGNTHNVVPGKPITQEKAELDLTENVRDAAWAVERSLTQPATDKQFAAYTLLTYNIGNGAWAKSTALKDHNAGRFMDACLRMLRWDKVTQGGRLMVSKGLAIRRYKEYNICISGVPNAQWTKVPRRQR